MSPDHVFSKAQISAFKVLSVQLVKKFVSISANVLNCTSPARFMRVNTAAIASCYCQCKFIYANQGMTSEISGAIVYTASPAAIYQVEEWQVFVRLLPPRGSTFCARIT